MYYLKFNRPFFVCATVELSNINLLGETAISPVLVNPLNILFESHTPALKWKTRSTGLTCDPVVNGSGKPFMTP